MALDFTTITENNVIRDLTIQVNNIGEELTKDRNVFDITDDLVYSFNKSQKIKLTDDKGLAKIHSTTSVLRDIKEPGYYYINARTLATMVDKPDMESIDVVLHVLPVDTTNRIVQQLYTLSVNNNQIKTLYRFVSGSSSSEWQFIQGLPNNKNMVISGANPLEMTTPGVYFVTGMIEGMPDNVSAGFLELSVDSNDNRLAKVTDIETGKHYTNIKKASGVYTGWKKELEPEDLQQYLPSRVNPSEGEASYNISVYKSDEISFPKAIENHIIETRETFITFYCQGGVAENPGGLASIRGIVMIDNPEDYKRNGFYGSYISLTTSGVVISGAISGGTWYPPKTSPTYKELWTGAQAFSSTGISKKLADDISNYSYVEIYIKYKTVEKTKGSDDAGTICHKFYLDGSNICVCSGTFVSGDRTATKPPITEFYRLGIKFKGSTWTIDEGAIQSPKTQYVTRIIGINMP
ncbi:hypothetical protein KMSP1_181 [Staphylococcus phage KMSP1]|nr:hypothetical protein KMSP1_181 [Staphylococcus phage KMSP1]